MSNTPTVAVIIPAYNEEDRIANVLRAVCRARLADEIIVVSDGSRDRTVDVARGFPNVRVIDLRQNVGKGGAMCAGVAATAAQIVAFVDADLKGLTPGHIDLIIEPIKTGKFDMCIGVFRGGKFWSDTGQIIFPYISGQRAMRRELFESIPYLKDMRFGVEISMHNYVKRTRTKVARVVLRGVSNSYKEQKLGLVNGFKARKKMYDEMYRAAMRDKRRNQWEWRNRIETFRRKDQDDAPR